MTKNVGGMDKWLRIAAGVILLALGLFGPLGWWGAIGIVPLVTGLVGTCPAYSLLGFNTCPLHRSAA
ncbi:YgaP family membrane protein [Dankookia sp. P2]|uniref:YgaP family membrane protein n=1 Tax=Dankookia sp. P2 TaxID=3423955 RepID=UPI003D66D5F1